MTKPKIEFSTVEPKEMPILIESNHDITLNFLYSQSVIPAGAIFEIVDDVNPDDTHYPVSISYGESIFFVDSSNLDVGFLTEKEYDEDGGDDYSSVIAIPVEFWMEEILSKEDREAMYGIEVMNLGQEYQNMLFGKYKDDDEYRPLDIPELVNKISDHDLNTLRKCVDFLIGERRGPYPVNDVVLVTNTNLAVTKYRNKYELYWLNNQEAEVYATFDSLEGAKEGINQMTDDYMRKMKFQHTKHSQQI